MDGWSLQKFHLNTGQLAPKELGNRYHRSVEKRKEMDKIRKKTEEGGENKGGRIGEELWEN